jgi:hypothetical protein
MELLLTTRHGFASSIVGHWNQIDAVRSPPCLGVIGLGPRRLRSATLFVTEATY